MCQRGGGRAAADEEETIYHGIIWRTHVALMSLEKEAKLQLVIGDVVFFKFDVIIDISEINIKLPISIKSRYCVCICNYFQGMKC